MYRVNPLLVFVCTLGSPMALSCDADFAVKLETTTIRDKQVIKRVFELRVPQDVLSQSTLWVPGTGPIPLSPAAAVAKAQEWIVDRGMDASTVKIKGMSLDGCPGEHGFRFYRLELDSYGEVAVPFKGSIVPRRDLEAGKPANGN